MSEIQKLYEEIKNFRPDQDFKSEWIAKNQLNNGIYYTQKLGFFLCNYREQGDKIIPGNNALTNSQIRNVFGEAKRIQMKVVDNPDKWQEEKINFKLLKPKLAYAVGRADPKNKIKDLRPVLDKAIDAVEDNEVNNNQESVDRLNRFVQFLEAILAYHKAYGGK